MINNEKGEDDLGSAVAKLVVGLIIILLIFWYDSCEDKKFRETHDVTEIEDVSEVPLD